MYWRLLSRGHLNPSELYTGAPLFSACFLRISSFIAAFIASTSSLEALISLFIWLIWSLSSWLSLLRL